MNGLVERLALGVQRQAARADGEVASEEASEEEMRDGLRVTLSELGKVRAAAAKNDDIDEADLPDNIKEILKMIRALRQQIAEKQAELQALMADSEMDPQLKQMRVEALRSELTSLQGALSTAQASLVDALKDKRLSDDQRMKAASLAMA
jgi:Sec-independent protein translocase protein TatA